MVCGLVMIEWTGTGFYMESHEPDQADLTLFKYLLHPLIWFTIVLLNHF